MKKMRALILLLCIAMLLPCLSLAGCGADPSEGNPTDNTPPNNGTTPDDPNKGEDTPVDPEKKLDGKIVLWNGDSICQGHSSIWGNWADRIADKNDLKDWENYGVGGGTIVENAPKMKSGKARHSVCGTLEKMHEDYPNADYIIIEGGTNDADLLGRITEGTIAPRFGSFDPDDFSGNYNRDTFCGALESIFYRAKQLWPDAKIGYIVAQKMGLDIPKSNNRYAYFQAAMQICEKWDIPYINLWDDSGLDPCNPEMYDPNKNFDENWPISMYTDGQHLTDKGYELTSNLIDAWLKTL